MIRIGQISACVAAALVVWNSSPSGYAQQSERGAKASAPLIVDGTVRQVYRSEGQSPDEYLVQIEVSRSEARKSSASAPGRSPIPGPGESVYVHVSGRSDQIRRALLEDKREDLPAAGTQLRAFLACSEHGDWVGASPDWYDLAGDRPGEVNADDPIRDANKNSRASASLGMTTELLKVEKRHVLRVTSVERGGPAQTSGLEVGDMIVAADGAEIESADQLGPLAAKGKKFSLVVVDVNTGRGARIEIDPQGVPAAGQSTDTQAPAELPRVSLGLSAEPVALGTRSALKVTQVDPDGPAAKAGIEPGDIIVTANGVPTTGVEQLLGALRKSGPTLKLTVRDSRTLRNTDVDVELGETAKAASADVDKSVKVPAGKLGAVTELAFHNSDFAVKVTEVDAGGAAARAGLRPGMLIVEADGKPVLHPNDLNDAVRKTSGTVKLTVVDPATGKKRQVDLSLK